MSWMHWRSTFGIETSSGVSSYEYIVSTLRASVFIMSLLGAFMMMSRTKPVGSVR